MCGIVGFASREPLLASSTLTAMRDTLVHRGPDDAGCQVWGLDGRPTNETRGVVGLGHRRLSIIDLSPSGRQPMSNETGDLWITYNGEFYNFDDYRLELSQRHRFASNTDTEVILHLFEDFGLEETLIRMNGMFAFALWDARKRRLFLARDRLGKKPLYYAYLPDGSLIFASEIKALLESGCIDETKMDTAALIQFWTYGYATGEKTIFSEIRRLLPGHYASWHDGNLEIREYWDCPFGIAEEIRTEPLPALAEELEELLCDAIRLRLVADVPVGLFLSGGIDSSLIAALTRKAIGAELESFTIGFSQEAFNEAPEASAVAEHLGLANIALETNDDVLPKVGTIARQFDELFGDSSSIPTYYLAKLARRHVTVALTGDAGDELFAGYPIYRKALQLWGDSRQRNLFNEPRVLHRRILDEVFRHLHRKDLLTVFEMLTSPRLLRRFLSREVWNRLPDSNPFLERERWYGRTRDADLLSQLQYTNMKTYLPDDILVKVDRMSMAWALECRCPFLDHRIVEFAARLPYEAKIDKQGRQKHILRHVLRKYIPDELMDRPKKGFGVPWAEWCRGPFGKRLRSAWSSQTNIFHRRRAASRLFPENTDGDAMHQWFAFCVLHFFENLSVGNVN